MALFPVGLSRYNFTYDNFGANPAATPGLTVTPTGSNSEGSFTSHVLATGANLAQDIYGLYIRVSDASATGDRSMIMDIGVDPAGGTSYTVVIANIVCGDGPLITQTGSGICFFFPIFIKAGSQVAVRIQAANATPGTVKVCAKFYGQPSQPESVPLGQFTETIGTITNSGGQSFTPGNAAAGTWQSLGTTAKAMWWWQLAYQVTNGTITAEYCYVELAYGDGSNKHIIIRVMNGGTTSETIGPVINGNLNFFEAFCPVPAGATLYVRGRCNNAPDTGYNAVAIGVGG